MVSRRKRLLSSVHGGVGYLADDVSEKWDKPSNEYCVEDGRVEVHNLGELNERTLLRCKVAINRK